MDNKTEINVFFSWQSDLPRNTNHTAISNCIKKALLEIEINNDNLSLIFNEATDRECGTPNIIETICRKISKSDIFICDITSVGETLSKKVKKIPNPNVLIELGYAIAELGWERIIMVFNNNYGNFPSDLPFDLEKRRAIQYNIAGKTDKSGIGDLTSKLKYQVELIVKSNPRKPIDNRDKSDSEIKRERDLEIILVLFRYIHIPTIDKHIENLPMEIYDPIFFFKSNLENIYSSTQFYLFDGEVKILIDNFMELLSLTLNFMSNFSQREKYSAYHIPGDEFPSVKSENDFNDLQNISNNLGSAFKLLINHLRSKYIEIDFNQLSDDAYFNYLAKIEE